MTRSVRVTDRAVLRYLERVHGLDVDGIRHAIADACARGADAGAPSIHIDNTRFINADGRIVTVLTDAMPLHHGFLVRVQRGGRR